MPLRTTSLTAPTFRVLTPDATPVETMEWAESSQIAHSPLSDCGISWSGLLADLVALCK